VKSEITATGSAAGVFEGAQLVTVVKNRIRSLLTDSTLELYQDVGFDVNTRSHLHQGQRNSVSAV
jgi:hypothetical protein